MFLDKQRFVVHAIDLPLPERSPITPRIPVEFGVNSPEAIQMLKSGDSQYGMRARTVREIPNQLAAGEKCISALTENQIAHYVWIQFERRKLTSLSSVPIPKGQAYLYRAYTPRRFRGMGVYSATLDFAFRWLGNNGYTRVFAAHYVGNVASRRGMEASGMRPVGEYCTPKVLWLKWATLTRELKMEFQLC